MTASLHNLNEHKGIAGGQRPPHDGDMEARIAVLEEIARSTKDVLGEIKLDLRDIKKDGRETRDQVLTLPTRGSLWTMVGVMVGVSVAILALVIGILTWVQGLHLGK